MAIIINSIGSNARNFSTIQAWQDSLPVDIVASGNSYVGELYNDSEFVSTGTLVTISGHTTDTTHTITLRCATGHSWKDNANKLTNCYTYNVANGVGLRMTSGYGTAVVVSIPNVFIDGIQIKSVVNPATSFLSNGTSNTIITDSILMADPSAAGYVASFSGNGGSLRNCLIIANTDYACTGLYLTSGATAINCTIVRPSNKVIGGSIALSQYGTATIRNCTSFGFNVIPTGAFNTDGHNVTDFSSIAGTISNLLNQNYSLQFLQSSTASSVEDFRLANTSTCIDAGIDASSFIPSSKDGAGTSRPQGTSWDVGSWEFIPPPPATTILISGPTSGSVASASSNFTLSTNGTITTNIIITPSDGGAGGTFTPSTVTLTSATVTGTFTYTAASTGNKTISITNNLSLINPSNIIYNAAAQIFPPTGVITSIIVDGQDVIVSGTTTNAPTSGLATLTGTISYGAFPLTLGTGTFTVTFPSVASGIYSSETITVTNVAGTVGVTGSQVVNVIGVDSQAQAIPDGGLIAAISTQNNISSTGVITVFGNLTVVNSLQLNSTSTGIITAVHVLHSANSSGTNNSSVGNISANGNTILIAANSTQINTASFGTIVIPNIAINLVGANSVQINTNVLGNIVVSTGTTLTPQDILAIVDALFTNFDALTVAKYIALK